MTPRGQGFLGRAGRGSRGSGRGGGTGDRGGSRGSSSHGGSSRGGGSRGGRGGSRSGSRGGSRAVSLSTRSDRKPSDSSAKKRDDEKGHDGLKVPRLRLGKNCHFAENIATYFNREEVNPRNIGILNATVDNPTVVSYILVSLAKQPDFLKNNIIYAKARLNLLPGYAEKKGLLLEAGQGTSHDEMTERRAVRLSAPRRLPRHQIEDGPDMEVFDDRGQIISMLVPSETPEVTAVNTLTMKYTPPVHDGIAVFAGKPKAAGFRFAGWFTAMEVELFAPNSTALLNKIEAAKLSGDPGREWARVALMRLDKDDPEWRPYPDIRRGKAGPLPYTPPSPRIVSRTFGSDDEGFLTQIPYSEDENGIIRLKGEKEMKEAMENKVDRGAGGDIAMGECRVVSAMEAMRGMEPMEALRALAREFSVPEGYMLTSA
ncbi:hypothetical protein B0J18DRAFT_424977 [Chaetomium sp. MPI-SDFR-AT-0129]|nr:hypothetical protein B0J18DRAFT_424977 [Chaetomium sp. MPI-SDFR-AT-0129]